MKLSVNKCMMINLMKCIYISFVVFMVTRFINVMEMETSNEIIDNAEEINGQENIELLGESAESSCLGSYTFHIMVFVIGAFWNAKKILKIGLLQL